MSRPIDWSPLAQSDPVPGDPDEVEHLADRYARTAQAIRTAVDSLRRIRESPSDWSSPAGAEFRDRVGDTATTIEAAFGRYERGANTLRTYAGALRTAQTEADAALRTAQVAQADVERAHRSLDAARTQNPPDPISVTVHQGGVDEADGRIGAARRELKRARQDWDQAGDAAAAALEDVNAHDGLQDSGWEDFLGVVQSVAQWAGGLSAILGVIAAFCAIFPGFQPFAALFASLALLTGLVALAADTTLYLNGKAGLSDVVWDIAGVVSFGAGRAFTMTARTLFRGARGLARPALIRSYRALGYSGRQAKRLARADGVTSGGRAAQQAASQAASRWGWIPRGPMLASAFNPVHAVRDAVTDLRAGEALGQSAMDAAQGAVKALPEAAQVLPEIQVAVRRANTAAGIAAGAGGVGNVGDIRGLHFPVVRDLPIIGDPPSAVAR